MANRHLDSQVSPQVHIIDRWYQDNVRDSKHSFAYAVQLKGGKWVWIREGATSESVYNQKYDSLEETMQIYNLIFYGENKGNAHS